MIHDAIIISDLHLGSSVCQSKKILKFLSLIEDCELNCKKLILNGDVFDSWDFRKIEKGQWKILSLLRKLADKIDIVWINGNHDGPAEIISHLLGIQVEEELIFSSGSRKILVLHGHVFDDFISDYPLITNMADFVYRKLQGIHIYWARNAKKYSKTFLRCSEKIEREAKEYAHKMGCNTVCCGHTHLELEHTGEISYYNSGCWTELPCHYLTIHCGEVKLNEFE